LYGRTYRRYYTAEEIAADVDKSLALDEDRPLLIGDNGFPILAPSADVKELGSVFPKWIGGWYNSFRYKDLSISMLIDGQFGQSYYNQMDNFLAAFGMAEYTLNRHDHIV